MQRILSFLCACSILVGCTTYSLQEALPVSSHPMGVDINFAAVFRHTDLGSTGTRTVVQSGEKMVMSYVDDTTGQKGVCDNLTGDMQCVDSLGTSLASSDVDTVVRVTAKTARRLIGKEYSLTQPDETKGIPVPQGSEIQQGTSNPLEDIVGEVPDLHIDYCLQLTGAEEQETESLCYGNGIVLSYIYLQGSSIIPILLQRTVDFYTERTFTDTELESIRGTLMQAIQT